jgi:hypothetical protein
LKLRPDGTSLDTSKGLLLMNIIISGIGKRETSREKDMDIPKKIANI